MKLSEIKLNPNNPRVIKDDRFEKLKRSIQEFPKMMELIDTMIIVSENMITLGKSKNGKVAYRLKECEHCLNWFNTKDLNKKYCSKDCYSESMKINKPCKLCSKIIENKHSVSLKNRIYCSVECQSQARKKIPLSDEWKKALSEGRKNSEKCKGENLYNWKGGVLNQRRLTVKRYYLKKTSGKIDFEYLNNLLIKQGGKCFYCNEDLSQYKAIEHLTPICKGGTNDWFNLVYSCKRCNSKKHDKTLFEFALSENKLHILNKTEQFEAKYNF